MQAHAVETANPFQHAREHFDTIAARLADAETSRMSHSDVERLLAKEGTELLRRLYQGHLDARGAGVAVGVVRGADGAVRTHQRVSERDIETVFGRVRLGRLGYGQRTVASLFPRDAELNLPVEMYSFGVRRRVADEVARGSFDEAVAAIERGSGAAVAKRQVEQLAVRAARVCDAFYEERRVCAAATPSAATSMLVMTTDGKGVVMRPDALREATRKAAGMRQRKLRTRLTKGEKTSTRRMATVAAVYAIEPFFRCPEDVVRELDARDTPLKRPRPQNKRVWASLVHEPRTVIEQMFDEATRRDPNRQMVWVVLVDGNETQLRLIKEVAAAREVEVDIVLDVIHVIEYLWTAAYCFEAEGTPEAEAWVTERLLEILRGNASHVAAGIRRSATLRNLESDAREPADMCANYLLKYREHLQYHLCLASGQPIATGVIEGACRYLVKDRMDITGARWGIDGAEAILRLRALRASGDLDEYWVFHEAREHQRNHVALYATAPPATVIPPRPARRSSRPTLRLVP